MTILVLSPPTHTESVKLAATILGVRSYYLGGWYWAWLGSGIVCIIFCFYLFSSYLLIVCIFFRFYCFSS